MSRGRLWGVPHGDRVVHRLRGLRYRLTAELRRRRRDGSPEAQARVEAARADYLDTVQRMVREAGYRTPFVQARPRRW